VNRGNNGDHPDLEILLAYVDSGGESGQDGVSRGNGATGLDEEQMAAVADHLKTCALCRLESRRFQRFETADEDPDAAADAQWELAEMQLARSWREKIQPEAGLGSGRSSRNSWYNRTLWLVPAVAAAVALFFFLPRQAHVPVRDLPPSPDAPGIFRGADEAAAPGITLEAPAGELSDPPRNFSWRTECGCEHYTLEIFTADLQTVFFRTGIEQTAWTAPDSLAGLLKPETIYLWSVRGYRKLQVAAESGNSWFMFSR